MYKIKNIKLFTKILDKVSEMMYYIDRNGLIKPKN